MVTARSGNSIRRPRLAVIGAGHMGKALAEGLLLNGVRPKDLIVADRSLAKTNAFFKKHGTETALNAWYPADWGDIIFLAVPPASAEEALALMKPYLKGKILVSLVAGLPLKKLQTLAGRDVHVARIMPNLPVAYGSGVIGVFFGASTPFMARKRLMEILDGLGTTIIVQREADLETVTILSGSGPGVVAYLIDALQQFGIRKGLSRSDAAKLVQETFKGTVVYLTNIGMSASSVQTSVATKGGVTEAILKEFDTAKVKAGLLRGMKKGMARIRTMRRT